MNEQPRVNCYAVDGGLVVDVATTAPLGDTDAGGRRHVAVN